MIDGYTVTNQNLVVNFGGHKDPGLGVHRHLPIFVDKDGTEYVSLNGLTLQKVSSLTYPNTRREHVQRNQQ